MPRNLNLKVSITNVIVRWKRVVSSFVFILPLLLTQRVLTMKDMLTYFVTGSGFSPFVAPTYPASSFSLTSVCSSLQASMRSKGRRLEVLDCFRTSVASGLEKLLLAVYLISNCFPLLSVTYTHTFCRGTLK